MRIGVLKLWVSVVFLLINADEEVNYQPSLLSQLLRLGRFSDTSTSSSTTWSTSRTTATDSSTGEVMGCLFYGEVFTLEADIIRGEHRDINMCYGIYCKGDGSVLHWRKMNCFSDNNDTSTTATTGDSFSFLFNDDTSTTTTSSTSTTSTSTTSTTSTSTSTSTTSIY